VTSAGAERRASGRPTAAAAAALATRIREIATREFLAEGYAATRIETIAAKAGVAKRTLYARWPGKPALFRSVIEQLMARWMAAPDPPVDTKASLETVLLDLARRVLAVALQSEALALHRLLIAESGHFPELARMVQQSGGAAGVARIAALLAREAAAGRLVAPDPAYAAEQFLYLVLTGPQRRALGLGTPLDTVGLDAWARQAIRLFLDGCRLGSSPPPPVQCGPDAPTKY
jgi:TetR/AcrR family transcriptional regulator, mexJK operon transcriptional repressor